MCRSFTAWPLQRDVILSTLFFKFSNTKILYMQLTLCARTAFQTSTFYYENITVNIVLCRFATQIKVSGCRLISIKSTRKWSRPVVIAYMTLLACYYCTCMGKSSISHLTSHSNSIIIQKCRVFFQVFSRWGRVKGEFFQGEKSENQPVFYLKNTPFYVSKN